MPRRNCRNAPRPILMVDPAYGVRVHNARMEGNVSQVELAKMTGLTKFQIYEIENLGVIRHPQTRERIGHVFPALVDGPEFLGDLAPDPLADLKAPPSVVVGDGKVSTRPVRTVSKATGDRLAAEFAAATENYLGAESVIPKDDDANLEEMLRAPTRPGTIYENGAGDRFRSLRELVEHDSKEDNMTRERTTWNRDEILNAAAKPRTAMERCMEAAQRGDERGMHAAVDQMVQEAKRYTNPKAWAKDVHTPNAWEPEYASKRIFGEADYRPEALSENLLIKKADLGVKVARMFLPNLSEADIEDQAVALMNLSDSDLIDTYQRLIADQEATPGVETRQ